MLYLPRSAIRSPIRLTSMHRSLVRLGAAACVFLLLAATPLAAQDVQYEFGKDVYAWPIHDPDRPHPPVVDPGVHEGLQLQPAPPPSDAIVLFDGSDLSAWVDGDGNAPGWKVEDGYVEVVPGTGYIYTKDSFGDVQLHVEWRAPTVIDDDGQDRGNSGVFFMNDYEVQVLDVYQNATYADGMAAALYGQYPPLVNANRPPGQWQTYDIVFRRPRFDDDGGLVSPATVTVFHNGVLAQDHVQLVGPTAHQRRPNYTAHPDRLPIRLQDHNEPVRFRNIWVRDLEQ